MSSGSDASGGQLGDVLQDQQLFAAVNSRGAETANHMPSRHGNPRGRCGPLSICHQHGQLMRAPAARETSHLKRRH